jgi:hypothetical protein
MFSAAIAALFTASERHAPLRQPVSFGNRWKDSENSRVKDRRHRKVIDDAP